MFSIQSPAVVGGPSVLGAASKASCGSASAAQRVSRVRRPYTSVVCRAAASEQVAEDAWIATALTTSAAQASSPALKTLQESVRASLKAARMPTNRNEAYRFTDLAVLTQAKPEAPAGRAAPDISGCSLKDADNSRVVIIDGVFSAEKSRLGGLPKGVTVSLLSALGAEDQKRVATALGSTSSRGGVFQSLNGALAKDVVVIIAEEGVKSDALIHIVHMSNSAPSGPAALPVAAPRLLVIAAEDSAVTFVEEFASAPGCEAAFVNALAEVVVEPRAAVTHGLVAHHQDKGALYKSTFVSQGSHSSYAVVEVALGSALSRHDLDVRQLGPQTETKLSTFQLVAKNSCVDLHSSLVLDHPSGKSDQLHKCIAAHPSARGVFDGNVKVNKLAQQTDAGQLSRNLLLVPRATVSVKPNLQIIADDVKCTHGCTVSDLEEDELFYFRSRGIDSETAREALVYSFGLEVVQARLGLPIHDLPSEELRGRVRKMIGAALEAVKGDMKAAKE